MSLPSDPVWVGQDLVDKYAGECAAGSGVSSAGSFSAPAPQQSASVMEASPSDKPPPEGLHRTSRKEDDSQFSNVGSVRSPGVTLLGSMGSRGVKKAQQEERCSMKQEKITRSCSSASSSTGLPESHKDSRNTVEDIEEEDIDLKALPSEGSRLHERGQCKPCAFFHTTGCQSGEKCKFCHLCPPREVQRRKQIRRRIQREIMNRTEQALFKASQAAGVPHHQQSASGQHPDTRGCAALNALAQARYPVMGAVGAFSMAPFAPMAAPVLMHLGGSLPGSYFVQPEAPRGPPDHQE